MADEEKNDVHVTIESQFENIELVQVVIDDSLQRLEFDEDSRYWIGIALREALANAIKHGNKQDPEKTVDVRLTVRSDVMRITVTDQGEGFDPSAVANPLDPDNLLKPDGRGIFYMKKFMDDIEYDFGSEGGTVVTLRKQLGTESEAVSQPEEEA